MTAGIGYRKEYESVAYFLNSPALTSHVFSKKATINRDARELEKEQEKRAKGEDGIPYSGRCKDCIDSGKFWNIVAAPVVFEGNPLGVLKLENKIGTKETDRFPAEDVALVELLAGMIGIVLQQPRLHAALDRGRARCGRL